MFDLAGEQDVVISGCFFGEDFEILHALSGDGIFVRAEDGQEWKVGWSEWRAAVFAFADRVAKFYAICSPKQPLEGDAAGFNEFKSEWLRRRGQQFLI